MTVSEESRRLAAIDVGSNSIRLVVADYSPSAGLTIIDELKNQPRLAAGLATTGRLDPQAMDRAAEALDRMLSMCRRRAVHRVRAVATAAVREAANGPAFRERIADELGLELEVIDGATEAELSYRSVAHHFMVGDDRVLVADIGGGSLELVGAINGMVEWTDSLPLGAVRLTDKFPPTGAGVFRSLKPLRRHIRQALRRALPDRTWNGAMVVGSGGTFTNLARMVAARRGSPATAPVHGLAVSGAEVEHKLERLASVTNEERAQAPGLNASRADIIVAGLAVTAVLLDHTGAREVSVSAFGLREGLLLEMAGADAVPASLDPMRLVREFAVRCRTDRRHVEQVRRLALELFDELAEPLGARPEERVLLEAAALLHDIGHMVAYRDHERHGFELIRHADRLNLAAEERLLVAHISRYHRKTPPSTKQADFAALDPGDRAIVRRMSGLLRVADGLDRGGSAAVGRIELDLTEDRLHLGAAPKSPGTDLSLECWSARKKADVLARQLARPVEIVQVG